LAGARRFCRRAPFTRQPACKPGSVRRRSKPRRVTTIPLGRRLPGASGNLPGRPDPDTDPATPPACANGAPRRPYSVLLPVGFALPLRLPATRCALTAPFHPCRGMPRRFVLCGTFPEIRPLARISLAGRYPAPHVHGARTFLPGNLSVPAGAAVQPTDGKSNGGGGACRQGRAANRRY
jgi:hypothetical protein